MMLFPIAVGRWPQVAAIAPAVAPTAPAQFGTGDWSVSDDGTGGDITITITALPSDGGSAITDLEYQLDGGSWVSLAGTTTGDYPVSGLTDDVEYDVSIRAVNGIGNGTASATKAVTPTTAVTLAIVSVTPVKQDADSTTITFTKPSGLADDDLLVVVCGFGDNATDITAPDGSWTRQELGHYGRCCGALFTKPISSAAGEGASYVFTSNVSRKAAGAIYRIEGVDASSPIADATQHGSASNGTAIDAKGATAAENGSLMISFAIGGWGGGFTCTKPASMSFDFTESHAAGNEDGMVITGCHTTVASGATGDISAFTLNASLHRAAFTVIISPI
jgi:hypothetical protein